MTEGAFLAAVLDECETYGVLAFHCVDSRRSVGAGFPDLVLVGRRSTLFAELKTRTGRPSPRQTTWKYRLLATGEAYAVWTPADLDSGLIVTILSEL